MLGTESNYTSGVSYYFWILNLAFINADCAHRQEGSGLPHILLQLTERGRHSSVKLEALQVIIAAYSLWLDDCLVCLFLLWRAMMHNVCDLPMLR